MATGVLVGRGYVSIRPEFEGNWSRAVSGRASSAGKSASASFDKAFSAGMRGVGALAAVAVASNLAGVAAAAAGAAPAMATMGAAAGALKLGLTGVGEAFKAAFADSSADAKAAATATRQVESAQRSLANAQRALADARVDAAERVRDAQRQVTDAERDLRSAQQDARDAQLDLNDARREATRALEDMNSRLNSSRLDEREAVLRLKEAEEELKAAQAAPGTDPDDLERLQIAYERAQQNLTDQRTETNRLAKDTKAANKAGVDGSEQVRAARERIADADATVADRQRALADAQAGVDKARVDGQRQIADAQRTVAEAAGALADAQANAAAQTSKLDEAMAKLSPNARSFVTTIRSLAPAWDSMRLGVQDALFAGLDTRVSSLATQTIPTLRAGLTETAGVLNAMARSAMDAVAQLQRTGMLEDILAGANRNLAAFRDTPGQMVTAWGQFTVAAQPAFQRMSEQMAGAITSATDRLAAGFTSGGLQQAIDTAFGMLSQLGTILADAAGAVFNIMKSASDAGGQVLGVVGELVAELRRITALPEVQSALRSVFTAVAQIAGAIAQVAGAALQAIIPVVAAIAPAIGQLAAALGPVLARLATALGAALLPIAQALMPVVAMVGDALIQIVTSITPLLAPIGQLIASVISALAPAVGPLLAVITGIVQALAGPLAQVVGALVPVVQMIGTMVAQVFTALQPVLAPLVDLIGQAASLLAGLFVTAVQSLLTALQPLIPVGVQLVTTVFGAMEPLLPVLGTALTAVAGALTQMMGPIGGVIAAVAQQLAPVFAQIAPILGQVAAVIAGGLAAVLPEITQAFTILVAALTPILPVLTEVIGMVVQLAGDVLAALMPSLGQLITAVVQLIVALSPILPVVAQLVGLLVGLAAQVLSVVLPPLVSIASFLVEKLAGALSTVIGWVADLVGWVAEKLGPIFTWLKDKVFTPVWNAIRDKVSEVWNTYLKPAFTAIRDFIRDEVGPKFQWFRDKVIVPVWNAIRDKVTGVWNDKIKPAFDLMKKAVGKVGDAFRDAKDAIGRAWDKVKDLTKAPIRFVINTVYNEGVVGLWNAAAKVLPLKKLSKINIKGFATGGAVYGPGTETSDSIPALLSRGEHVWTAREVRGAGGHAAVETLRRRAAGNRYAKGGPVGAHGGVGDWFGGKLQQLGGLLGKAKDWVLGGITSAARAAAGPIRELISGLPGGGKGWGQLATAVPKSLLSAALDAIRGSEDSELAAGGQWVKPVAVPYGTRFGVAGRMWSSGRHTGLDFPARTGTAVRAVAPGTVTAARSGGPYGHHLMVSHGHGLQSLYAHLSQMLVRSGRVSAGQAIGRVGATGNVTGPHLHLEARLNGRPVDPMGYLTGSVGGAGGSGVARWRGVVQTVLREVGQPLSLTSTVLRRMNQESGGNPTIVNRWDSNWAAGHPSVGLMQVIRGTFERYAGKYRNTGPFSYGVSTNPRANIYASMRYALARYGSLASAYNRPGGYAAGGAPRPGEWAWVGERGPELLRFGTPSRVFSNRDSIRLAGTAGAEPRQMVLEGPLYLEGGQFLGVVRGVVRENNGELLQALSARPRR